jgi:peptide/nickel transport system permease protein
VFGFDGPASLVLPVIALAMWPLARFTRILRTQLVEVLNNDYVRSARAKGLGEWTILRRHALPNAALPWLAIVGMDFGSLLGGSIVIETVFVWPGIGNLMVDSIGQRDYPVLQACIFVVALLVVLGNLLADLAYRIADPRVRH